MTFSTKLQTFQGSNTYQDLVASSCIPLWGTLQVYITGGNGGWTTMAKVGLVGGAEADSSDLSSLNDAPNNVFVGTGTPWGIDQDGQLYCRSGLGMSRIDPSDWTRHDTWGSLTYGLFPPPLPACTGSNDALGGVIVPIKNSDGTKYWISGGVGGAGFHGNDVFLQSGALFAGLYYVGYDPGNQNGCNGPDSSGFGYYTTHDTSGASPALIYKITCVDGSWVPGDWPTPNPNTVRSTVASIDPTDVDAAWGNIQISGLCRDLTDENLLVVFQGDAGSFRRYLTKVNSTTGALVWSTAVDNNFTPGQHMRFSQVRGRFYFVTNGNIYGYSTSDGSQLVHQTTGVSGLSVNGQQMWADSLGIIVGNFIQAAPDPDSPEILNTSPAFVAGSQAWMALYVASPATTPGTRRWIARPGPVAT